MIRLFILIFSLNAFITPVLAKSACEMMDGSNPAMMTLAMSEAMVDMDCEMNTEATCASAECTSSCFATTASQLISEKQSLFIVAGNYQPLAGFAYFYKITLPVSTPPPLV